MVVEKSVLDPEVLKSQTSDLTDEQKEAIRLDVQKDIEKSSEEEKDDEENESEEEDQAEEGTPKEEKKKENEETPEDKTAREIKEKEQAEAELLKKPDEELSEEEKPKKAELVKHKQEAEFTEEAKGLALERKISVEDAKKELESYNKIAEKYKSNPKEMAKALLNSQREYLRLQTEHNKLKNEPQPGDLQEGEAIVDGKKLSKEEVFKILVDGYRKEFPEIAEDMDDPKVYRLAVTRLKDKQMAMRESERVELSGKAKEKRSELINSLTDNEKEYAAEIKGLLEKTSDHVLMHPDWNFGDVKNWARGKYFTSEKMEDIRKEAFKKGVEEAKILGEKEKKGAGSGKGITPPAKKTVAAQLTEDEKNQALSMYRMDGITDEQKFEMFLDYKEHQRKVDKNRRT